MEAALGDKLQVEKGKDVNFVEGLFKMCGAGEPTMKDGLCIFTYAFN